MRKIIIMLMSFLPTFASLASEAIILPEPDLNAGIPLMEAVTKKKLQGNSALKR